MGFTIVGSHQKLDQIGVGVLKIADPKVIVRVKSDTLRSTGYSQFVCDAVPCVVRQFDYIVIKKPSRDPNVAPGVHGDPVCVAWHIEGLLLRKTARREQLHYIL